MAVNMGFRHLLITNVELDKWCTRHGLELFYSVCKVCGAELKTDLPFAGENKRGLLSAPCECGNESAERRKGKMTEIDHKFTEEIICPLRRGVEVFKETTHYQMGQRPFYERESVGKGWFLEWGVYKNTSAGIVEFDDGTVKLVDVSNLKFTEVPGQGKGGTK